MSHNPGDAATTARAPEADETQTPSDESNAQGAPSTATPQPQQGGQSFANNLSDNPQASAAETRDETSQALAGGGQPQTGGVIDRAETASARSEAIKVPSPVESAQTATPQPTGDPDEGVASSANVNATSSAEEATRREFAPRPDVSDQGWQELVPKLLGLFNNNREQLARALGLHRSTVDRWLNGKSKPNTSTILRMRRLSQERQVE